MAQADGAPIGTRVVFENGKVRVWEIELQPGETLPMHHHAVDHIVVGLSDGPVTVEREDGRREETEDEVGEVSYEPAPQTHALRNSGDKPYRNRVIELL